MEQREFTPLEALELRIADPEQIFQKSYQQGTMIVARIPDGNTIVKRTIRPAELVWKQAMENTPETQHDIDVAIEDVRRAIDIEELPSNPSYPDYQHAVLDFRTTDQTVLNRIFEEQSKHPHRYIGIETEEGIEVANLYEMTHQPADDDVGDMLFDRLSQGTPFTLFEMSHKEKA